MSEGTRIAVIGAGAFGTALATVVARRGEPVILLGRDSDRMEAVQQRRINELSLPGITLPDGLAATTDKARLQSADTILLAVPAQALRTAVRTYHDSISEKASLVICAKGIERESGQFLADVLGKEMPDNPAAVLSGPGFAADIARGLPTAMTLAGTDISTAEALAERLSGSRFRLYASDDLSGVQTGGALKNVLAIACGIVEGRGLGDSARAALIARGLAELMRFSAAHGGRARTVSGLSGLGDLVLTATSHQSRNLRFGIALGKGQGPDALMAPGAPLSEGAFTATVAARISLEKRIDMPITQEVAAILRGDSSVEDAVENLMTRPLKSE
ncbi:NAD(P)H-dependent glycerol-3-phosphate dehydrogenase [Hoeflea poritis]|uniref:Glycerol-3-phosphate dehydrogenase [NAD(P)+] n=1 Tax=Hoeflea poritis TaxID=2993659 RepID=A0ABT4VLA3_9HYPH|nr:NAD(P)H-dependent glycerol-3-phosphate dehydrogenase [Hoeflea poritis]MDA4845488.1 NAD(P)-dependent glycerol-3-phosphate dehydrogenase [Hoeflea poritis]